MRVSILIFALFWVSIVLNEASLHNWKSTNHTSSFPAVPTKSPVIATPRGVDKGKDFTNLQPLLNLLTKTNAGDTTGTVIFVIIATATAIFWIIIFLIIYYAVLGKKEKEEGGSGGGYGYASPAPTYGYGKQFISENVLNQLSNFAWNALDQFAEKFLKKNLM